MRDIAILLFVLGSLPFILKRPWYGIMLWVWLGVMNPHKLSWGFAYDFPFSQLVAVTTLIALLFESRKWKFPWTAPTVFLLLFMLWMTVSSIFALYPENIMIMWTRVMKMVFMVFIGFIALYERKHIEWLVWVIVISLGFYGVKGGIFTITGGAIDRVYGPPTTFIEENNTLAVALLMAVPLMWYLSTYATKKWLKWGLMGSMICCAAAALGSYSRGALVTIVVMSIFFWIKSTHKVKLALLMLLAAPLLITMLPDKWFQRMDTIGTYEEDESSMGRINAWQNAFNLAKDRPLVGGGFNVYNEKVFARYAPEPDKVHAAHSIYFAALGEHGWVGLSFFLLCFFSTWRVGSWIVKRTKNKPELKRERDLAMMVQVSLIAYAVGGAFLSLLYFDVPYYLIIVLVLLKRHVEDVEKAGNPPVAVHKFGEIAAEKQNSIPSKF